MTDQSSKISIIVPVYDVAPYLGQCLDSIAGQTYTNLEVFLIDDHSDDRSGKICDDYAEKDGRFTVIHLNRHNGPSAARNIALKKATGDYIGFVDSDDVMDPHMLEVLMDSIKSTGADASICDYYEVTAPDDPQNRQLTACIEDFKDSSGREVTRLILQSKLRDYSWNKLLKKELLEGIEYPEGVLYEDICVVFRFFEKARLVTHVTQSLYYYLRHQNSITCSFGVQKEIDYHAACLKKLEYCEANEKDLVGKLSCTLFAGMLTMNNVLVKNNAVPLLFTDPVLSKILNKIRQNRELILDNYHGLFPKLKLKLLLSKNTFSHKLMYILYQLTVRRK